MANPNTNDGQLELNLITYREWVEVKTAFKSKLHKCNVCGGLLLGVLYDEEHNEWLCEDCHDNQVEMDILYGER